jgi:hypothetical protein
VPLSRLIVAALQRLRFAFPMNVDGPGESRFLTGRSARFGMTVMVGLPAPVARSATVFGEDARQTRISGYECFQAAHHLSRPTGAKDSFDCRFRLQ